MAIQNNFPNLGPSLLLDFANSKKLDPRITFTRASTGTYYDGKTVVKAEENLILQSQTFDSSPWTLTRASVSANAAAAPDGTTTADKLVEDTTASNNHYIQTATISTISGSYTFSVFAKASGRSWLRINSNSSANAYFDLTNGVIGTVAGATASIISIGSDWYRCVVTVVASTTDVWYLTLATADNTYVYTGNGTDGVLLWGAQLEQRSSVTAYTATTTQPITNYIPVLRTAAAGIPRFDHDPITGDSLGLLIESAKTNTIQYSQEFDNVYWTKTNSSILTAQNVAPDGTLTAQILNEGTGSSVEHGLSRALTMNININYTFSVYVKNINGQYLTLAINRASGNTRGYKFDLTNLTATSYQAGVNFNSSGTTITAVGNGWYRIEMRATLVTSTSSPKVTIGMWDGVSTTYGTSTGLYEYTGTGRQMYIWGAQFTAGVGTSSELPTSYIATSGASATRQADVAVMTGTNFSSWYNVSEGTFYAESIPTNVDNNRYTFGIDDGTATSTSNYILSSVGSTSSHLLVRTNNVEQVNLDAGTFSSTTASRIAVTYKVDDFAASIDGGTAVTDTNGLVPQGMARLVIGTVYDINVINFINGPIRKLAYYPFRLTNAQLQAITG